MINGTRFGSRNGVTRKQRVSLTGDYVGYRSVNKDLYPCKSIENTRCSFEDYQRACSLVIDPTYTMSTNEKPRLESNPNF